VGLSCFTYPYGDGLSCSGPDEDATEQHFTGKQYDPESGNYYFGARYDADNYGRFLTPDWSAKVEPVPYAKLDDPQSLNLYAFVLDNPVSAVDGTGHDSIAAAEQQVQENANSAKEDMGWYLMYMAAMAPQELSAEGWAFIERKEGGFHSKVYDASGPKHAGDWTIGYGHKVKSGEKFSGGITRSEALAILSKDVHKAEAAVNNSRIGLGLGPLPQNEFDALVDLAFNAGAGAVARGNEMMRALYSGHVGESNFTVYHYAHDANGKLEAVHGLFARREAEWRLYSEGVY